MERQLESLLATGLQVKRLLHPELGLVIDAEPTLLHVPRDQEEVVGEADHFARPDAHELRGIVITLNEDLGGRLVSSSMRRLSSVSSMRLAYARPALQVKGFGATQSRCRPARVSPETLTLAGPSPIY